MVSPRLRITGFSRSQGPVCGDTAKFDQGQFDPDSYFGPTATASSPAIPDAKLLGLIPLKDVIPPVTQQRTRTSAQALDRDCRRRRDHANGVELLLGGRSAGEDR